MHNFAVSTPEVGSPCTWSASRPLGHLSPAGWRWPRFCGHMEAMPGTPLLQVDLTLAEGTPPAMLVTMLINRDLGFLSW